MSADHPGFFITGGTLRPDAPSYVERQADRELFDGLLQGEFCYVLTSRQMGKSSLMVRTVIKLREQGVNVIALDLTALGQNLTPGQWYDGLVVRMGRQLRMEEELERYWLANERLGPCQRLFASLHDVVMARRPGPLVIFVDEIDTVRSLPFSIDEFFAAIRECFNRRAEDAAFNRLTFCLLGVATPSDLIRDTRTTPFNIGRRVELHDFTESEAAPLAQGLRHLGAANSNPSAGTHAEKILRRILYWTGGHPYLTQRFCHAVAEEKRAVNAAGVDQLCQELFLSNRARERDDNLIFVRERLLRAETDLLGLLEQYLKVRRGRKVIDDESSLSVSVLKLSGIVRGAGGRLLERNRIYSRVFDGEWVRIHMPDAELRRQRAAFRRGVFRTTAIAAAVVAALGIMAVTTVKQTRLAQKFSAQAYVSYVSQAQAARVSGAQGQRLDGLAAIKKATSVYKDEATLRDAAIGCLALVDLKEKTDQFHSLAQTAVFELNPEFEISATTETSGAIILRTLSDRQLLNTLPGFGSRIEQLRFSPNGALLAAQYHGRVQDRIEVWDWRNGDKLFAVTNGICLGPLDFSWDSRKLAVSLPHGQVSVYSLPEGKRLLVLKLRLASGFPRTPNVLRFSPSGHLLAESCLDDSYVQLWDLRNLQKRPIQLFHPNFVYDISWHPQGRLLTTACGDSCVYIWDTNHLDKPTKKLLAHEGRVRGVAFNHRGNLIASIGHDETIRLWVPATERQMACRLGGEIFERVRFSANDHWLVATGHPQTNARIWEVFGEEYVAVPVWTGPVAKVRAIDFSPDGRLLAAVSAEHVMILDSDSGREMGALSFTNAHDAWFSADGRHLIASTDNGLFLCAFGGLGAGDQGHFEPGAFQPLTQVSNELGAMALTRDRNQAAIVRQDEVRLVRLDLPPELDLRVIPVGVHYQRLSLHPSGSWLAAMMHGSNSIHLWSLSETASKPVPSIIPGTEYFSFSHDGQWLATCWAGAFAFYRVGGVGAWQKPQFSILRKPVSDQHAPIAFSQDGATVAVASSRYTIQWFRMPPSDQKQPEAIATLESPDRSPIEILAFSPDGRRLAVATQDRIIQIWNLALLRESLAKLKLQNNWPDYP